jgi:hypothetical protein
MSFSRQVISGCVAAAILVFGSLSAASAQQGVPIQREQVVSANPFGLLFELFNAEYERRITEGSTAGLGGSFYLGGDEDYYNADAFWRFYPGGRAFEDWAFGVKGGVTNLPDSGTFFGMGFDVNRSWILGANRNFYVGAGIGLKRLFGPGAGDLTLRVIPTIRLINVGVAF